MIYEMDDTQTVILQKYNNIHPDDWLENPKAWKPIQWHFWGTIFTDMSIGYGEYFLSFAANLKTYLEKETIYLVCGNKDELMSLLFFICKSNILPVTEEQYHLFRVRGNKVFEKTENFNLEECSFEGTRDSEVHFKIFLPLSSEFVDFLFRHSLLVDSMPDNRSHFKVFQKRLPDLIISKLRQDQKNALFAGVFDGDGSAAALVVCPTCGKRNTIRSDKFICSKCSSSLEELVRSMDYNVMLDSGHFERLKEELEFLVNVMRLKGHIYALCVKKERPDKLSKSDFENRLNTMSGRMLRYESLASKLHIPIVIKNHILKDNLPSYHYAPDVYGSIKFLFTPHFRSNKDKLKWFGTTDIHQRNLSVMKLGLEYIFISKKRCVLSRVIKNKGL